ncbi:hypothetical protein L7F22_030108 [Adiantum nelumboides]|nr:hypothetical protein [Adiantum nelumboides]
MIEEDRRELEAKKSNKLMEAMITISIGGAGIDVELLSKTAMRVWPQDNQPSSSRAIGKTLSNLRATMRARRCDKTLAPIHLSDRTMDNILTIPTIIKVKVSDVSTTQHIYGTWFNVERPQELPVEEPSTVSNEWEISLALDKANNESLCFLGQSFDVTRFDREQILYFGFGPQEIAILQNSFRELTDQIINLDLWKEDTHTSLEAIKLFLLNSPLEIQEHIIDRIADTGTVWRTGLTLHICGIRFQRGPTLNDKKAIQLACHLGLVNTVRLIPYLIEVYDDKPSWGVARTISRLSRWAHCSIRSVVPRTIPIVLEEEDKDIVKAQRVSADWYDRYEKKYNLLQPKPLCDEDGWLL